MRFDVHYVGPDQTVLSSIGLPVTGVEPLPRSLPDRALVIVSGTADVPLGHAETDRAGDAVAEKRLWRGFAALFVQVSGW